MIITSIMFELSDCEKLQKVWLSSSSKAKELTNE